jgi:hypothetical protein
MVTKTDENTKKGNSPLKKHQRKTSTRTLKVHPGSINKHKDMGKNTAKRVKHTAKGIRRGGESTGNFSKWV